LVAVLVSDFAIVTPSAACAAMVGGAWSVVALLSIGAPRFVAGAFLVAPLVFVALSAFAAVFTEVAGVAAAACFVAAVFLAAVFVAAVFVGVVLAAVPFAGAGAVVADFAGAAFTVAFVAFATVPAGAAFAVAFVAFAVAFVACAAFEGADALLVVPVVPVFLAGDAAAFEAAFRAAVARSAMASPRCKTGARRGAAHSRGWQGYGL
jgi:hypothetical protein